MIQLAPREVQQTHKLLNTGWALATIDNTTSGLVPINYVRRVETKSHHNQSDNHMLEQQQTSMIVPEMQPNVECMEKSPEIETKLNATNLQDCAARTAQLDTIYETVTNQSKPPDFLFEEGATMPADLKDL